jgi:hypothetical protein
MTKVSAKLGLRQGRASALALSAASALWLGCAGAPAFAADDGYAPIWDSLGSIVGWGKDKDQKYIDYRDEPRLVVPPSMDLPPPALPPAAGATDWPRDQEIEADKREQAEKKKMHPMLGERQQNANHKFYDPNPGGVVTTNYTAGQGPSQSRCTAGPGETCDTTIKPTLNMNPLSWVGLQKKAPTVLGPEPERDSLTDPPVGYRAPAEGVGAKVDSN